MDGCRGVPEIEHAYSLLGGCPSIGPEVRDTPSVHVSCGGRAMHPGIDRPLPQRRWPLPGESAGPWRRWFLQPWVPRSAGSDQLWSQEIAKAEPPNARAED